jgi:thiosulfate reductase cytochrome b subunit
MADSDSTRGPVPIYEHPWTVRFCHWANAVTLSVMVMSGLQIFTAFPSFGAKIPQQNVLDSIPDVYRLGGWLGGGLQWHFTFMWLFAGGGAFYLASQLISGHFRTVRFRPRDISGVWPMARHYFLFGPKPPSTGQYNPLQKLAYTSALAFGLLSVLTGLVMFKAAQFSTLGRMFGGYRNARLIHFLSMCGLLAFIPGHLIMVALHGWDNFMSMVTGWKRRPDYQPGQRS